MLKQIIELLRFIFCWGDFDWSADLTDEEIHNELDKYNL